MVGARKVGAVQLTDIGRGARVRARYWVAEEASIRGVSAAETDSEDAGAVVASANGSTIAW